MALQQYGLDTGPEGTALSNGNSGSTANSLTGGSTVVFAAAMAAHGAFGAKVDVKAASQALRRWTFAGGVGATNWAASIVFTLPASAPGNALTLAKFATAADSVRLSIILNAAGDLVIADSGLAHQETVATGLTWGAKYRVSIVATGGSATASSVQVKVYSGTTSWTTQVGATLAETDWNLGTDQVNRVDIGSTVNSAAATIFGFDDIQLDDGRTTEIPDFAIPNAAPTVTAGPRQSVAAGATVNLTFTAADGDGSIASRATTFDFPLTGAPTITGGTTATPSFPAGTAPARYLVRQTVTDNLGATAFATTEVVVPAAGAALLRPEASNGAGVGTWTRAGSATTDGAALADESSATYLESASVSAVEQTRRVRWLPGAPKAAAIIRNTLSTNEGTAVATVRLYEGTTLRQQWTGHNLTVAVTEFADELLPATIAAIGDWTNLYVEVAVVAG